MIETGRIRAWPRRQRPMDALLTIAVTVVVLGAPVVTNQLGDVSAAGWAILVIACGAVYFRRAAPLTVTVITLVCSTTYLIMPDPDGPVVLTFAIAIYTLMATGRLASGILIGAVAVVASFYGEYSTDQENLGDLGVVFFAGWLITVMAVGGAVHSRRAYLREVDERTRQSEANREEELRRRTTEERLRIARELHDVLGHTISLINVQASAALHRMPRDPDQAVEALTTIKQSSHEALQELRTTLGVLRQVDEAVPTAPAPSLAHVPELISRLESAGFETDTDIEGEPPESLPPAVDLAGYRIVQEALTNVTRHSGASAVTVRIRYGDDVQLNIIDDGRGGDPERPGGSGVIGMKERAASVGGRLEAGPGPEGGFVVQAWLPLRGQE
ncbi:histidine kinase [Phytoactinopolyspora mesophila]|uniref:histidine kinase n=1 Tax=Phytoactinopolyspora mesophila TaxID=2650750 RepID=UPI001390C0C4